MITKKCKIFTFIAAAGLLVAVCYAQDPQTNANTRDIANLGNDVAVRLNKKVDKVHFSTYSSDRQAEINGKVKSVSSTLPIVSSGGTTPTISLASVPFGNNSTGMRAPLAAKAPLNGAGTSGTWPISIAGTATALAATPTLCSGVTVAQGITASGNATSCITPAGTYSLPTATTSVLGGVKPDGTSILNTAGVLSATAASVIGYTPMKTDYSNAGTAPTWNQNTSGTAAGLSGSPAITVSSINSGGGESVKIWTYTHTVTAAEITATFFTSTISTITIAKVRSVTATAYTVSNGRVYGYRPTALTQYRTDGTTSFVGNLGIDISAGDVVSFTIIEAL